MSALFKEYLRDITGIIQGTVSAVIVIFISDKLVRATGTGLGFPTPLSH